jgi:2'-hydroxyisoflavone reductase
VRFDTYGPLKVGCERAVQEVFGGRSLIVRAGLIVGPDDGTNRFTYWVTRIADGGEVLVPDAADQPLQVVDVRDLGTWLVEAARARRSGTVNVEGPRGRTTLGGLLALIREVTGSHATLRPVPAAFLERHGVQPWQDLPLWLPVPELQGMVDADDTLARELGMTFRPYEATIAETLAWARTAPPAQGLDTGVGVPPAGLSREREAELLAAYTAEE